MKEEENRALRKNIVVVAPVETEEEIFQRELAALTNLEKTEDIDKKAQTLGKVVEALTK